MSSRVAARAATDPATWAVETTLYRALAVLRFVVLINSIVINLVRWEGLARPMLAAVSLAAMAGWTAFATWAYDEPRRRRAPLLVADLAIAVVMVLMTLVVQSEQQLANLATLPSFWVMAVVLAWAAHWGWVGGVVAAATVSATDIAIRPEITQTNIGNIFLLMLGGLVVGYASALLKEMSAARDRAERQAAAAAERARLARAVHDGVLQVLSLVQRRGLEIGGETAELGRLAGEQEAALRSLVQHTDQHASDDSAVVDVARHVSMLGSRTVTVSVPGSPVLMPTDQADEVVAVVRACLDNVTRHVGPDAPAWVLLEDMGTSVVITVRDEGQGIPEGRLEEAAREGRLGVSESICGRVADLGGEANLVTAPGQGVEWELTIPREVTLR